MPDVQLGNEGAHALTCGTTVPQMSSSSPAGGSLPLRCPGTSSLAGGLGPRFITPHSSRMARSGKKRGESRYRSHHYAVERGA